MHRYWPIVAFAVAAASPRAAEACGCLPNMAPANPVVQAGERILFHVHQGEVTAHIQIAYTGQDTSSFGWLLPVPALPDLEMGSDAVFTALGATTGPNFQVTTFDNCQRSGVGARAAGGGLFDCGCDRFGSSGTSGTVPIPPNNSSGDPNQVVIHGSVGPYDFAVVKADAEQPLTDWLTANRYFLPVGNDAVLKHYIGPGLYFLALRMMPGRPAGDISPVIVHYKSDLPMIPIMLTAATSTRVLPMNIWILGPARAVPRNFYHGVLNDAAIDWTNQAGNYNALVEQAAREAPRGQLFITEFAGGSDVAAGAVPAAYASLFQSETHLTRLYTQLAQTNMTADPVFSFNADLPAVPARHTAEVGIDCLGSGDLVTEQGFHVPFRDGASQRPTGMPATSRIEILRDAGPPEIIVDNVPTISALLAGVTPTPQGGPDLGTDSDGGNDSDAGIGLLDHPRRRWNASWAMLPLMAIAIGVRRGRRPARRR